MPLPKRPHVASPDQVRITRDGDDAIIEYADDKIATTHFKMGADKLARMTDAELLDFWNEHIEASEAFRQACKYRATEIPVGKPQVEYFEEAGQWVPRGHVLRCEVVFDTGEPADLDEPVVSIDGRDFTAAEFIKMLGTYAGWGMRIVFVPKDELHEKPKITVKEPKKTKRAAKSRKG